MLKTKRILICAHKARFFHPFDILIFDYKAVWIACAKYQTLVIVCCLCFIAVWLVTFLPIFELNIFRTNRIGKFWADFPNNHFLWNGLNF